MKNYKEKLLKKLSLIHTQTSRLIIYALGNCRWLICLVRTMFSFICDATKVFYSFPFPSVDHFTVYSTLSWICVEMCWISNSFLFLFYSVFFSCLIQVRDENSSKENINIWVQQKAWQQYNFMTSLRSSGSWQRKMNFANNIM